MMSQLRIPCSEKPSSTTDVLKAKNHTLKHNFLVVISRVDPFRKMVSRQLSAEIIDDKICVKIIFIQ